MREKPSARQMFLGLFGSGGIQRQQQSFFYSKFFWRKKTCRQRSDSDFAKDPERRRSVSGYDTILGGAPVTMTNMCSALGIEM